MRSAVTTEGLAVTQWVHAALDGPTHDPVADLVTEGFRLHLPPHAATGDQTVAREALSAFLDDFHETWGAASTTVEHLVVSGDRVAVRLRTSAVHQGSFRGGPPSGLPVTFPQTGIFRLGPDGRLAEGWLEADHLGLAMTLGVVPPYDVSGFPGAAVWAARTGLARVGRRIRPGPAVAFEPVPGPTAPAKPTVSHASAADEHRVEVNVACLRRWVDECINGHEPRVCVELFDRGYVGHSPTHAEPEPLIGQEGYARFIERIHAGFPDVEAWIEDLLAAGDTVVCRLGMRGTHLADYRGLAATGRRFVISQIVVCRLTDGRITESWQEIDAFGLLLQLGYVPTHALTPLGVMRWLGGIALSVARTKLRAERASR